MRITALLLCALAVSLLRGEVNEAFVDPAPSPAVSDVMRPASDPRRLWKASLAAVAVANALDIHSSWGKRELNGTLATSKGTFGCQGVAFKLAFQGGMVGVQYLVFRGRPNRTLNRVMAILNFGAASVMTGTAVRNYGIPRPPR
jgi:hypothetical protein